MNKYFSLLIFFLLIFSCLHAQEDKIREDSAGPYYTTALKINLNGTRVGIEQKIAKRFTVQLEGLFLGNNSLVKVNPQLRYYPRLFRNHLCYIGLGYFYKHKEYSVRDSVRIKGTQPYYDKDFYISKYINAFTLNYGFFYDAYIFRQLVHFEANFGIGIRYKKSNRMGILPNEEIDYREAMFMRPQYEQDTKGRFAVYPELNAMWSLVLPIKK